MRRGLLYRPIAMKSTFGPLILAVMIPSAVLAQGAPQAARLGQAQTPKASSGHRFEITYAFAGFRHALRQEYNLFTDCVGPNRFDNCRRIDGPNRYLTWDRPHTGARQVGGGLYWNDHWKTDVSVAWTDQPGVLDGRPLRRRFDLYEKETIYSSVETKEVSLFHTYDLWRTSVSQLYRFRPASRVRPHAGVAVGIDRQTDGTARHESVSPARGEAEREALIRLGVLYGGSIATATDVFPTDFPPPTRTTHVHVFGRAGLALRVWKRVFVVGEAQLGRRVAPVSVGLGVDLL